MTIAKLRTIYEDTTQECQLFAATEFEDARALVKQDEALNAQLRALTELAEVKSTTLSDVLLKFETWQKITNSLNEARFRLRVTRWFVQS